MIGILQWRPSIFLSQYLLLNHWTKSNQIWCASCLHEWGVQRHIFGSAPWVPVEGPKGQMSLNFNYKVLSNILKQALCFLTNERYKTYPTGFSFRRLGHALGVGLGGTRWFGHHIIFFKNLTKFGAIYSLEGHVKRHI